MCISWKNMTNGCVELGTFRAIEGHVLLVLQSTVSMCTQDILHFFYRLSSMSMLGNQGHKPESAFMRDTRMAIYITLACFSLVLNGTFLIVLWKGWNGVKRMRITYHVTHLAIADFLVGTSTLSYSASQIIASKETPLSKTLVVIAWTATLASLLAVCLMSIERAVAIKKPYNWMQILTKRKIFLAMAGNWFLTTPLAVLVYFYTLPMKFVLLVLFYVPICVTSAVYFYVYWGIWKHTANAINEDRALTVQQKKTKLLQRKVCGFVLLLTAVLLITVSPSFLCLAVKTACELFELNCSFIDTVTLLSRYFYMMELSNFALNPILYVWRMNIYRKAFWQLFGKK